MKDILRFDVAIVGGGMVGASIAYWLAPRCRVVLLEGESAHGYHATGRSAALYASAYGPPMIRALTRASRGFFDSPPDGFTSVPLLGARGALFVADAARADEARSLHASLAAGGAAVELLVGSEIQARVPALRTSAAALGVYDADAFDIDVDALLQGLLRGARSQGAKVLTSATVGRVTRVDAGDWRVETQDGRVLDAGWIVNAAGAWADDVARMARVPTVGIEPRRRTAFLFDPPSGLDCSRWPAVIDVDERWYFKPDAGLLLGSPANADPVPAHDVVPEELDVATGIHLIEEATTLRISRPRRAWAGLRSFVADGEPVCGALPRSPRFLWAAALGGYGIQTAPAFGRLCADLILDGAPAAELRAHGVRIEALAPARLSDVGDVGDFGSSAHPDEAAPR